MSILWWEKTVEYFFIQKHVNLDMFVAPLDGNHEKAGDAIFSHESKWVLIEFKRNKSSIEDEIQKFKSFANAKASLELRGKHHLIIYGDSTGNKFNLSCQEYFSGTKVDIGLALSSGVEKNDFVLYLRDFISFKKNSESGAGGYGFVAGISNDGKVTKCMSLSEFAEALKLEAPLVKRLQKAQEQKYSGPGFNR